MNLLSIDDGGTNANARFATMRAMGDDHSFQIDKYHHWTMDWARTPDGHYYANKAPGPTLLAFPLFYVIDMALKPVQEKHPDENGQRQAPRGVHKVAISTLFQVLPFLLISLLLLNHAIVGANQAMAYFWAGIAILFGNTAAVLMNSYMGNPFAGMAMLGFALAYMNKRYSWMGFLFGLTVLAEYPAAIMMIPLAGLFWVEARQVGYSLMAKKIAAGASLPAVLWCWYHTSAFGSPLSLPFQYEVMAVVGKVDEGRASLWGGLTSLLPDPKLIFELLFGPSRGLLFTQPWVPLVWAGCIIYFRHMNTALQRLFLFSFLSFVLMLWLNAGFPGWHGGGSPGPRYLSAILPIFGLFIPFLFQRLAAIPRTILAVSVIVSLAFRGLVFATWILPPAVPLWPYFLEALKTPKASVELSLFVFIIIATSFTFVKMAKSPSLAGKDNLVD